jgi:hypothetical protein
VIGIISLNSIAAEASGSSIEKCSVTMDNAPPGTEVNYSDTQVIITFKSVEFTGLKGEIQAPRVVIFCPENVEHLIEKLLKISAQKLSINKNLLKDEDFKNEPQKNIALNIQSNTHEKTSSIELKLGDCLEDTARILEEIRVLTKAQPHNEERCYKYLEKVNIRWKFPQQLTLIHLGKKYNIKSVNGVTRSNSLCPEPGKDIKEFKYLLKCFARVYNAIIQNDNSFYFQIELDLADNVQYRDSFFKIKCIKINKYVNDESMICLFLHGEPIEGIISEEF